MTSVLQGAIIQLGGAFARSTTAREPKTVRPISSPASSGAPGHGEGRHDQVRRHLYPVSTDDQTCEIQHMELETSVACHGWPIVATFTDEGISGAKGRDKRPGFDVP